MLLLVSDTVKDSVSIIIDGIRFVRCRFIDCQLIYRARDDVDFQDCTFERCSWTFDDAAERTIGFLATLQKTVPDGRELVDGIFESIRSERVAQLRAEAKAELTADAIVAKSA